jgi:SAM-dependent methyltransferase
MASDRPNALQTSYDTVAAEYARHLFDELSGKPFDRRLLDDFAALVRGAGPVCDLGCGPGQVARYLHDRGVEAFGIDLSPGMVAEARRLNPDVEFHPGDMLALAAPDGAWAGIAAFYSLIHIPREQMVRALRELRRVLRPGGWLLAGFHVGREVIHRDELWDQPVSIDFRFFLPGEMEGWLREAGFALETTFERAPYPEVEYPSRRGYVLARKP